jgi:hypothetical protein
VWEKDPEAIWNSKRVAIICDKGKCNKYQDIDKNPNVHIYTKEFEEYNGFRITCKKSWIQVFKRDDGFSILMQYKEPRPRKVRWLLYRRNGMFYALRRTARSLKDHTNQANTYEQIYRDIAKALPFVGFGHRRRNVFAFKDESCGYVPAFDSVSEVLRHFFNENFGTTDTRLIRYPQLMKWGVMGTIPSGLGQYIMSPNPMSLFKKKWKPSQDKETLLMQIYIMHGNRSRDINCMRTILSRQGRDMSTAKLTRRLLKKYGEHKVSRIMWKGIPMPPRKTDPLSPEYLAWQKDANLKTMYSDTYYMLRQLKGEFHFELPPKIANIKELHDLVMRAHNLYLNKISAKILSQPIPQYNLPEQLDETHTIVQAQTGHDLQHWGQLFHNCIGGYIKKATSKRTILFAVATHGKLTHTVEYDNERKATRQCMLIYNRHDHQMSVLLNQKLRDIDLKERISNESTVS